MQGNSEIMVSIITATYNCESFIEKTILSVLGQDYNNIQFIIIDGGSIDGTLDIIKTYEESIDIIVSEKDRGISDAFNKGVCLAQGHIIFFLNAGDVFVRNSVVTNVISDWSKNQEDIIFYRVAVGKNAFIPAQRYNNNIEKIWNECEVPHQGAFLSRYLFERVGYFNVFLKTRMDLDWFARCRLEGVSYRYIPEIIVSYAIGGMSMKDENARIFYLEGIGIKLLYGMKVKTSELWYLCMPMWIRKIGRKLLHR